MATFRRFGGELMEIDSLLGATDRQLRRAAAQPVMGARLDDAGGAPEGAVFGDASQMAAGLLDRLATLVLRLDAATDEIAAALDAFLAAPDRRSLVARLSPSRAVRKARDRLDREALPERIGHLLSVSDGLTDLHERALRMVEDCSVRAEVEAERVALRAARLLTVIAGCERQAASLDARIAEREAGFTSEAGSEAAADLARGHTELAVRLKALTARQATLRAEHEALCRRAAPLRRFLTALAESRVALRVARDKLLGDTERRVVLSDGIGTTTAELTGSPGVAAAVVPGGVVQTLSALRHQGALPMPAVERRRAAANAAFAAAFPALAQVGEAATLPE